MHIEHSESTVTFVIIIFFPKILEIINKNDISKQKNDT